MSKKNIETKQNAGFVTETKQEDRNGVPVGLISGYIATWDIDRGDDRFVRGAFAKSIQDHIKRNNRQIRFKDNHGRTVGGFPINGVFEDDKGLFGTAEVNLDVQQGKEAFSLAKQKVLTDFSLGYSTTEFEIKDGIRIIEEAILWEGSIVDEPMNIAANIVDVKDGDSILGIVELEAMDTKDVETYFKGLGCLSKSACIAIASRFVKGRSESDDDNRSESGSVLIDELKKLNETLKGE